MHAKEVCVSSVPTSFHPDAFTKIDALNEMFWNTSNHSVDILKAFDIHKLSSSGSTRILEYFSKR